MTHFIPGRDSIKTTDFLSENMEAVDSGTTSLKYWKKNTMNPEILYPVNKSFKNESKIKAFSDRRKLRAFITVRIRHALQETLQKVF